MKQLLIYVAIFVVGIIIVGLLASTTRTATVEARSSRLRYLGYDGHGLEATCDTVTRKVIYYKNGTNSGVAIDTQNGGC